MKTENSVLLTDLYQLTMLQGYFQQGMNETAVFELFVRRLPEQRNFLMAAGLAQALDYLEGLRFTPEELDWLASSGRFDEAFLSHLASLRFTGDVDAMPEGTVFFANEPILRIAAPMMQAQLIESRLINLMHFQTLIASKAARCVQAAPGKLLVDFGLRRAHGAEGGLLAARASYLAGFSGSSTVLAEPVFGIKSYGTMAHSFIEAHDDELKAFEHFALAQPDNVVLLIDTYDTEQGARKLVELAPVLEDRGITIKAVRLDSGDLVEHAERVRRILDQAGLNQVKIFSSGGLDEYKLTQILAAGAPIDGFGVGTLMDTSADAPYLDAAYKLQEYAGQPRRKRSEGKATWPGRKQVYRQYDDDGRMAGDIITVMDDRQPGQALLQPTMRGGQRTEDGPTLDQGRAYAASQLAALPEALRGLEPAGYEVTVSEALRQLAADTDRLIDQAG